MSIKKTENAEKISDKIMMQSIRKYEVPFLINRIGENLRDFENENS